MKLKKILFAVFALLILVIPFYIIMHSEDVLENGHLHKIKLQGYDPFDPFRGKFLRLSYDNDIPCDTTLKRGDQAYVILEKDSLGFSFFSFALTKKPKHDDFIEAEILYVDNETASIKIDNLTKYFINEGKAKKAEKVIQDFTNKKPNEIYVAVRVLNGESRLQDIFIENMPLLDYLKAH